MSRKIDALVAEHAMGLPDVGYAFPSDPILKHSIDEKNCGIEVEYYSTDIAMAMLVVSEVMKDGRLTFEIYSSHRGVYDVEFQDVTTGDKFECLNCTSLPKAICLAALKYKEVPYNE